jgi:hypothetical protein
MRRESVVGGHGGWSARRYRDVLLGSQLLRRSSFVGQEIMGGFRMRGWLKSHCGVLILEKRTEADKLDRTSRNFGQRSSCRLTIQRQTTDRSYSVGSFSQCGVVCGTDDRS